ncbi:MAG: bifunctional 4-hydroxy-2-oxoglutarate aldolase/2-dehydro-3-deoxy-phosphogluconate aldolase [Verrucomicrobiae bacterium]|nr:bifunctional 4-hydroxy-2-oxoglutarate aldolase/2-dehydro-3-deoxy-phosphogluconate aldolase [Verrucomicrobiae bacterium]MCX7722506.1 bifunctional 4-hydroxy-2-oxoglutarate aldolase/2-dehydro-3-deoxy-phosphogluconate aldolase [Verrucomicrobiae bacterium]MDW7979370.1 bifunctional 4-hydroxy-2-oxoglutarate aldolase/2-dehydro-3-deoxy-phosphogluconate aldolase [Verrucomicrobiales bacterium]
MNRSQSAIWERVFERRVIAVAAIDTPENAVRLADALLAGGLDIIEITFRTAAAEQCIAKVREKFPTMLVGAGTVLEPEQLVRAQAAGAQFGVAPGLNERVVQKAAELGMPFMPGVMTPSEVERALGLGCKLLKFFPAQAAGGTKTLKALAGPYAHTGVKFIPLGGIDASNAAEYLAMPIVAAVGGTWLADAKLVAAGNWTQITALTKQALEIAAASQRKG